MRHLTEFYEEKGYKVIITEKGWCSYVIVKDKDIRQLYLETMFIFKEFRGNKEWKEIADSVFSIAEKYDCDNVSTTISTIGNINVTRSMKMILSYGFQFLENTEKAIIFTKGIK